MFDGRDGLVVFMDSSANIRAEKINSSSVAEADFFKKIEMVSCSVFSQQGQLVVVENILLTR